MSKRFILTPYSADGIDSIDALTAALGNNAEEAAENTAEPESELQAEGQEPQLDPEPEKDEPEAPPTDQQAQANYAWAQMRNENKQLTELLGKMAEANGIKYTDKKDLIAQLNEQNLQNLAQRQNIPVDLLREVQQLRQDSENWKKYQHEQAAAAGFQAVATQYGLDQKALEAFAVELDQAGRNPFTQQVDVLTEYKTRHFDEILQAGIQKGIEAALGRDAAANNNSSTPSAMQGAAGNTNPSKVDTVAALSALLSGR